MRSGRRLLAGAVLTLVVAAAVIGLAVHDRHVERAESVGAALWPTSAVLLEDAAWWSAVYGGRLPVQVDARWIDRVGIAHTGVVTVDGSAAAGSVVEVWIDAEGRAVDPPEPPRNAVLAGAAATCAVLAIGGALLYALAYAARSLTDRW